MKRRNWTNLEIQRLLDLRAAGKSIRAAANALGRSFGSTDAMLRRIADTKARRPSQPRQPPSDRLGPQDRTKAVKCLAAELAAARAERATAPLLRSWPEGTWSSSREQHANA